MLCIIVFFAICYVLILLLSKIKSMNSFYNLFKASLIHEIGQTVNFFYKQCLLFHVHLCVSAIQYLEEVLKYCNYVFTIIFVIEALLKLVAFGIHRFFKDR